MPTFDLVVVGSGGGPSELNISAYLLKARDSCWSDGVVGIEAGSGLGALKQILERKPDLFNEGVGEKQVRSYTAPQIYSNVRAFLVSHAHLDHVMGLILLAGTVGGPRKSIRSTRQVLEDLEESIFRPSRIWPNLASWNKDDADHMYLYDPLDFKPEYTRIHKDISVRMMALNHGSDPTPYQSSAFFIRHDPTEQEFLFFGDVEPDSLAKKPLTIDVWRVAAPKIPHRLNTIFIECSYPSGRSNDCLYGHLTPDHLVQELENLAREIVKAKSRTSSAPSNPSSPARKRQRLKSRSNSTNTDDLKGALKGVRVYVMHFKEDMENAYKEPIHVVITRQVKELVEKKCLGAEILAAEQGAHIVI
ncbi:hypothetical protein SCHPADRAFT_905529 [Schizopora paradoxa]|uniref:Cyclic-AMP phosphodiesterase n=1 Tax=Schizopora paradoxa TaxID=27342 RepID=A0A0H2S538_9AGAM|nr:hypothetical protein SCHPADRAFT_905529 [Schizopora paradoxa]